MEEKGGEGDVPPKKHLILHHLAQTLAFHWQ